MMKSKDQKPEQKKDAAGPCCCGGVKAPSLTPAAKREIRKPEQPSR